MHSVLTEAYELIAETLMIHYVVVLGDLVLGGIVAPGLDEKIVRRRLYGINDNRDGDFHYHNDAEGGLD